MDQGRGFPYFDPDFDSLMERIPPPRVCIDNETCKDYTIVKVDSANRHGILLEMVQVLTDLDLVVSKSYISSDGGWLMDVFHVTDQLGCKLTDNALISYLQQSLASPRKGESQQRPAEVKTCLGNLRGSGHIASDCTALEVTATDRPGLLYDLAAELNVLSCDSDSGVVWTHNGRAACILYVKDSTTGQPISDPPRLSEIEEQVRSVVEARHFPGEPWGVRLSGPTASRVHTERRLHQLLQKDKDYEAGPLPLPVDPGHLNMAVPRGNDSGTPCRPQVSIDSWKERDYSVVNVRSRDRPKLMFDTVCALTDLEYEVFHASIRSHGPISLQEYYVRRMDGGMPVTVPERRKIIRSLAAAVERRVPHGTRMEMRSAYRRGVIFDFTWALRENNFSLAGGDWAKQGDSIVGSFYIIGDSSTTGGAAGDVDLKRQEAVSKDIGGGVLFDVNNEGSNNGCVHRRNLTSQNFSSSKSVSPPASVRTCGAGREERTGPKLSLKSLFWSRIERFSSNFGFIRSS